MKTRFGFVTNSSSSSFLIALKKENGEYSQDLKDAMMNFAIHMLEENSTPISTIEELDKEFLEYSYCSCIEELKEEKYYYNKYLKAKAEIEKGNTVYLGEVSDEDYFSIFDIYANLFKNMAKSKDFIGIETEMGY